MNRRDVSALTRRERTAALMRVVAYRDDLGSYPYPLSRWERQLIASSYREEWDEAARFVEVERRLIAYQFGLLERLLSVFDRHPESRVLVNGFHGDDETDPESHALLALPADTDRREAWTALYQLGWAEPAR